MSKLKFIVGLRPQIPSGLLGTGDPRTSTSTFTQLLSSDDAVFATGLSTTTYSGVQLVPGHSWLSGDSSGVGGGGSEIDVGGDALES